MSTPTVADLSTALGAHLAPHPGFEAPAVPLTAVHISELLDPSPYLSGGELLLTTGLSVPTSRIGCDAFVTRLLRAQVAALGIGLGPVHAEPPEQLVASCHRLGLPLLVVPAPTPFLTISKAYWQAVARSGRRVLTDALAVQQALVDAAASAEPVPVVLRRLAEAVDGWAAVLTPDGAVAHVHPPASLDEATELQREIGRLTVAGIHSASSFGTADRNVVVHPMTVDVRAVGYLAVGMRSKPDPSTRRSILAAAALLSLVLSYAERLRASEDAGRGAAGESVAALLELGHVGAARELAEVVGRPPLPARGRVLVLRSPARVAVADVLARLLRDGHGRWVDAVTGWFLLSPRVAEGRLATELRRNDPDCAGLLTTVTPLEDVPAMLRRALDAVSGLRAGEWRIPGEASAVDPVARLDELLAGASTETLAALAAYLRHRGRWEAAARELEVHRNTLRYRVARAVELLGVDVDDPDVAARLWLALRERMIA